MYVCAVWAAKVYQLDIAHFAPLQVHRGSEHDVFGLEVAKDEIALTTFECKEAGAGETHLAKSLTSGPQTLGHTRMHYISLSLSLCTYICMCIC